jgi:hypothetical protein
MFQYHLVPCPGASRSARGSTGGPLWPQKAVAANNRGNHAALSVGLSPEVELHSYPDVPDARPADQEPVYYGCEGYVKASEVWKAGLGEHSFELRELVDPRQAPFQPLRKEKLS